MSTLAYRPDLDGLRALAVIVVIAFHYGLGGNGPGGVTVFFALSGFLITSILLGEHVRTGTIDLPSFYRRRARRLLPPATLAVLVTLVWSAAKGLGSGLGRQALSALTYWANWERFGSRVGYGESGFAPFTHFWSLAIEEQFYFLLPVLVLLCLRKGRKLFAGVCASLFVLSASYALLTASQPMSYFNTGARVCELLAGSLLAVAAPWWQNRTVHNAVGYLSLAGLVGTLVIGGATPLVVSALTLGVIVGRPSVLKLSPLVAVGKVSYGLYLFHPLALIAASNQVSALALTIGATLVSYYLLERPIRFKLSWPKARAAIVALSLVAVATACLGPYDQRAPFVKTPAAPVVAPSVTSTTTPDTPVTPGTTVPQPPLRISVAGDSTMTYIGQAFNAWAVQQSNVEWIYAPDDLRNWTGAPWYPGWGLERPACGLLYQYPFRWRASDLTGVAEGTNRLGDVKDPHDGCDWHQWIPEALSRMDLDVLVVSFGPSLMWEHKIGGKWLHAGQSKYDQTLATAMDDFETIAASYGTKVIWIGYPYVTTSPGAIPLGDTSYRAMEDHKVTDAVARMIDARPCSVNLRSLQVSQTVSLFADGDHMTPEGAALTVAEVVPNITSC